MKTAITVMSTELPNSTDDSTGLPNPAVAVDVTLVPDVNAWIEAAILRIWDF